MEHALRITSITPVTHDVLGIVTEKPPGIEYLPGQAADISINHPAWREEKRAFTFTSLPDQDHLEFTIKTYPERKGVTNELLRLKSGDELLLWGVFGDIAYKGRGLFIAGGAGITPFISIFRFLKQRNDVAGNKLIFANKKKIDIIRESEFRSLLGNDFVNILSDENTTGYAHGFITESFLRPYTPGPDGYVYLCGPPPMMDAVLNELTNLGIREDRIVKEAF